MADTKTVIEQAYSAFNKRDIDGALALMTQDVSWPKASEGGRVVGKEEVRAYWTRQWREFDPHVEPLAISDENGGKTLVRVHLAPTAASTVTPNLLKTNDGDRGDGGDGRLQSSTHPSDRYAAYDSLCDHCGYPSAPADPLRTWDWPGRPDGIWLHSRCEEPWLNGACHR